MKKHAKIMASLGLATISLAGAFGAQNASAAEYIQVNNTDNGNDPTAVKVCRKIENIVGSTINNKFYYGLSYDSSANASDIDLSKVTITEGGSVVASNSAAISDVNTSDYEFLFEIDFNKSNVTAAQESQCATLNFAGAFDADDNLLGGYAIKVSEIKSENKDQYPVAISNNPSVVRLTYLLSTDDNDNPIVTNGKYRKLLTKKNDVEFTSGLNAKKTHIELKKIVRGNVVDLDDVFTFSVNAQSIAGAGQSVSATYNVYNVTQSKLFHCALNVDCKFTMSVDDIVKIGFDGSNDQFVPGTIKYTISEDSSDFYTIHYLTLNSGEDLNSISTIATNSGRWSSTPISNKIVGEGDKYGVLNTAEYTGAGVLVRTLPFILLIAIAGTAIVIVRKSSKKSA